MELIKENKIAYSASSPFEFQIRYVEITRDSPQNQFDSHVHSECEIYINLSGDVSFMVEDQIYEIMPGSIVITRPFEYHHCIYHSNACHKHFWILFSSEGNEAFLERFFDRPIGSGNLLTLDAERQTQLILLCHEMLEAEESACERQYRFFRLLHLLNRADFCLLPKEGPYFDAEVTLEYINAHYAKPITVAELARRAHVSVNTLERHFGALLHMSPSTYLRKKRLSVAAELLYGGASVSEACMKSGFSDYSKFISLFKKNYGTTPLKYKQSLRGSASKS